MKISNTVVPLATLGLLLSSTAIYAQSTETRSVTASVQGALQAPTGFLTGGQVQVTGVGQGSVVLNRAAALVGLDAGASSSISTATGIPSSSSEMVSAFNFDREVVTSGALVGIGNVVAQGESLGGLGIVGSASSNATSAGTRTNASLSAEQSGSSTTPTTAQGSLVGDFTTTNTMQLTGTGSLFAGAQTLSIGERNVGISAGITGDIAGNASAITLDTLTLNTVATGAALPSVTTGAGAGFQSTSTLTNSTIDMNVSNAGNGTALVSASTGGFFGQGTAFGASAAPTFSEVNGFFTNP